MFVICVTCQLCVMCYVLDIEGGGGAALVIHLVNEDEEGAPLGEGAVNHQLLAITENINLVRVNIVELEAANVGGEGGLIGLERATSER